MILDTNALSALVDGDSVLESILRQHVRWYLPVIVLGEYRYGISRSRYRGRYEEWLQQYLPLYEILPIFETTTHFYAELRWRLHLSGTPIPANDAWIAALALEHNLPLLSRDVHFDQVLGIRRIGW